MLLTASMEAPLIATLSIGIVSTGHVSAIAMAGLTRGQRFDGQGRKTWPSSQQASCMKHIPSSHGTKGTGRAAQSVCHTCDAPAWEGHQNQARQTHTSLIAMMT